MHYFYYLKCIKYFKEKSLFPEIFCFQKIIVPVCLANDIIVTVRLIFQREELYNLFYYRCSYWYKWDIFLSYTISTHIDRICFIRMVCHFCTTLYML